MFTYSDLKEAPLVFWSMMARTRQRNVFLEVFLFFRFSRSIWVIKRQWARFGLSFPVVNIIKMISVIKLRLYQGTRSPMIIWLCLWLYSICFGEISQNLHNFWYCLADHLKAEKNSGYKGSILAICNFVFLFSISNLFSRKQGPGRVQICLTVQQILRNSTVENALNLLETSLFSLSQNIR